MDKTMCSIQSYLNAKMTASSGESKQSSAADDKSIFGSFVAAQLRKFNNTKQKRSVERKITDLLYDALDDDEAQAQPVGVQYLLLTTDQAVVQAQDANQILLTADTAQTSSSSA